MLPRKLRLGCGECAPETMSELGIRKVSTVELDDVDDVDAVRAVGIFHRKNFIELHPVADHVPNCLNDFRRCLDLECRHWQDRSLSRPWTIGHTNQACAGLIDHCCKYFLQDVLC